MGLYRRGKIYWFNFKYKGKRIQDSLETDNKRVAEIVFEKVLNEIVDGSYFEKTRLKKTKFDDMVNKYLKEHAKQRDSRTARYLMAFFSGYTLSQISTQLVSKYRTERLKTVKPATVYLELALMRRMYNVAIKEWEWLNDNPVSRLSFSVGNRNARDRWLTIEQEENLLNAATNPKWLRNLLMAALHTGMRRGEILNLKWQDIDFKRKLIVVMKSKNKQKRSIPMSDTLYNVLGSIQVRDISGRVFPISGSSVRHAFDKTVSKAGIEDFRFHDLRHTFATRLVQNGVDLYKVKELLGHKTISMTMRYSHHCPESLRSSVKVLDLCYNSDSVVYNRTDENPQKPLKSISRSGGIW